MFGIVKEAIKFVKEKKDPIKGAITYPFIFAKLLDIRKHIYVKVADMTAVVATTPEPVSFAQREKLEYKPIKKGEKWGDFFDCAWFNFKTQLSKEQQEGELYLNININGEGCIFDDNGTPIKGISGVLSLMDYFSSVKGKHLSKLEQNTADINIWVEGGNNGFLGRSTGFATLKEASIVRINKDIYELYYDYLTAYMLMLKQDKAASWHNEILAVLKKVSKVVKKYKKEGLSEAKKLLRGILSQKSEYDFEFFATGHAHLDLAWLWPIRETKRKAVRTFSNQLELLERFDDYVFGASQPQQFDWIKELYPELYQKIKEAVKTDRFELQGGMWVEADTNLSGGESLVRQALYGKRFFEEEFGKEMKILWLPDVFGFSGALPQIMKKSNMDYFLTIKLFWNKYNKFPYHSFIWKGIDDSEVIVHMPPEGSYVSDGNPSAIMDSYKKYNEKNTNCAIMLYGVGDGGGGPGEAHFEVLRREKDLHGLPRVKPSKAIDFFEKLNEHKTCLPVVKGELYLETHQGTFTSQAKNKYYNRKIENELRNTEFMATVAAKKGYKYPKTKLEKIWKEVLLYQFHDIIPGSSIERVHKESVEGYEKLLEELAVVNKDIQKHLSQDKPGLSFVNTQSFARKEYIKIGEDWQVVEAQPFSTAKPTAIGKVSSQLACGIKFIENDKCRIFFHRDGSIKALFEKATNRNFAGDYLNKLTIYQDKKSFYNAWDIDINYTKRLKQHFKLVSFDTIIDGPMVIRRNHYRFNKSSIVQDVVLKEGSSVVEFKTEVDWHETHKMLRADFRPSFFSDKVICNIQWGNIERSTKTDNCIDYAQFEVCAHKFVYIKKEKQGFALLNDCKYGHRVKDGLVSLNLLRSPIYPDKTADRGKHVFTYAILAKSKSNINEVTEQAYRLNNPLVQTAYDLDIPSQVSSDKQNVIIEVIKPSEDCDRDIILRAYESAGINTTTAIKVQFDYVEAFECNMLENDEVQLDLNNLEFAPYEIKTIKLRG